MAGSGLKSPHRNDDRVCHKQGLPDANKVIELDPKNAPAYDTRGHIFEALDRKDEAIADFRKALELDPSDEDYKENLKRLGVTP